MYITQSELPTNDKKYVEGTNKQGTEAKNGFIWLLELVSVCLFFALLTVVALWPAPFHLSDSLIGDYQGDFWKHLWGHWWVRDCLAQGQIPLFCDLLNAPRGGYLFIADPCNAIWGYIFSRFVSLAGAYNLTVIFNLWLGLLAAWLLARHFVKDGACALVAAVIYGLSAYVLSYPVSSGVTETLNTAWAPLYILFLHRLLQNDSIGDLLGTAIFFALTTFSCWYYGEFMAVYTSLALAWSLVELLRNFWKGRSFSVSALIRSSRVRKSWRRSLLESWNICAPIWKKQIIKVAASIAIGAIIISPFAWLFKMTVSNSANIVMPRKAPKRSIFNFQDYLGQAPEKSVNQHGVRGFHNYTNLLGLFLPGKGNATVTSTVDRLVRVHYLGWIALLLAFTAWRCKTCRRKLLYWVIVFGFFIALSLGPRVIFSDFSEAGFINPFYLLMFLGFPFFYNLAIPFRFLMLALIGLSIVAAYGSKVLWGKETVARKWFFCVLASLMIFVETAFVSPLPWPLPISPAQTPAYYQMLAEDPRSYAIIDYPFERPGTILVPGEYFYYQTVHHKRIPYRTSGVLSPEVVHNAFMEEVLLAQRGIEPSSQSKRRLREGAQALLDMGFYAFVLHENLLTEFSAQDIESRLTPILGAPMRFGDGLIVYNLESRNAK